MNEIELDVRYEDDSKETAEVYVKAEIDGSSHEFLLDTGCAQTTLNFDEFSCQYEILSSEESSGLFSRKSYDVIKITDFKFGSISKKNVNFRRGGQGDIDRKLLGMDIMKDHSIGFFYKSNKMVFDPDLLSNNIRYSEFKVDKGNTPYIEVEVQGKTFSACWDTGASVSVASSEIVEQNPENFTMLGKETGTDSTGTSMETEMYHMKNVEIGGIVFNPIKVGMVDLSHVNKFTDVRMDLVLGYSAMRQADWVFDFPSCKWNVKKLS